MGAPAILGLEAQPLPCYCVEDHYINSLQYLHMPVLQLPTSARDQLGACECTICHGACAGVRYIQAPLGVPRERLRRLPSIAFSPDHQLLSDDSAALQAAWLPVRVYRGGDIAPEAGMQVRPISCFVCLSERCCKRSRFLSGACSISMCGFAVACRLLA